MGTFHHGKGELHGITIVVDTPGPRAYIGRCDTFDDEGVVLLDVDVFDPAPGSDATKEAWMRKAAQVGVWKKFDGLRVPNAEIASVRRLADLRS